MSRVKPHIDYAWYVARHKAFVFRAGIKTGAPIWRLVIHDWSKLTPAEWGPYVDRFMRGDSGKLDKSGDSEAFHRAWTHHWHLNPHHWEHWVTTEGAALRMPEPLVREMVADWMGAGRAITGRWGVADWYAQHRDRIHLHPESRALAESLIARFSRSSTNDAQEGETR